MYFNETEHRKLHKQENPLLLFSADLSTLMTLRRILCAGYEKLCWKSYEWLRVSRNQMPSYTNMNYINDYLIIYHMCMIIIFITRKTINPIKMNVLKGRLVWMKSRLNYATCFQVTWKFITVPRIHREIFLESKENPKSY